MSNNTSLDKSSPNFVDRPSFHWRKKYLDKVNQIVEKNIETNNSTKVSIYDKFPKLYKMSWFHYLPLFIGYVISLVDIFSAFGRIKASAVFDKGLLKYYMTRYYILSTIAFIFGPLLLLVLIAIFPLLGGLPFNSFATGWSALFGGDFDGFVANVIQPTFNSNAWWIGILAIFLISMVNITTIAAHFIINKKNDQMIILYTLEDNLKMKISRFANSKGKKILRKKVIEIEVPADYDPNRINDQDYQQSIAINQTAKVVSEQVMNTENNATEENFN